MANPNLMPSRGVLAVDIGTTIAKVAVFEPSGRVASLVRAPAPGLDAGGGRSEMDMDGLWTLVAELIREAVSASGLSIEAIGITAICSGAWLVSPDGRPVRPAILWNDGRAADQVEAWNASGVLGRLFAISGNAVFPGYTPAVIRWLQDHEPRSLDDAAATLCCKDWIRYRLTGTLGTDPSDASYMLSDLAAGRFSGEVWKLCGIERHVRLLPTILEPGAVAGVLLSDVAESLGLPPGIPVVVGLTDVAAATLGAGALAPGEACTILGTSCLNTVLLDHPPLDGPAVGVAARTVGGLYLRSMVNTAGTMASEWFLREVWSGTKPPNYAVFDATVAAVPIGARGVVFHPYLNTTGVLSPFVHAHARAQFFGISVEHGKPELGRAVLEGVALSMRDGFAAMPRPPTRLRLVGGGSRSPVWCGIIANCLGIPVDVMEIEEPGAWGVAMLALVACGLAANLPTLAAQGRIRATYQPHPRSHQRYTQLFDLYQGLQRNLAEHWTARAKFLECGT